MFYFQLLVVSVLGLVLGSFMTSLTYRWPLNRAISKGRSICPKCGKIISWYDNIPVLSYLLLKGKCRRCGHNISPRYILIELTTGVLFAATFLLYSNCSNFNYYFCSWRFSLGNLTLPFLLLNVFLLISVLVIDFEHQLILDEIVFIGFVSAVIIYILSGVEIYSYLLTGFGAATALLLLNIVTRGRGMGLGDVKFAIYGGIFFKPFQGMVWLFLSFIIGALIGLTLILFGKSKFGQKIAFGPFLVISLLISLIFVNSFHLF